MSTRTSCTCGVNNAFVGGPHEASCNERECGACGEIGTHSRENCPEFAVVRCCGAVVQCFGCPLQAVTA